MLFRSVDSIPPPHSPASIKRCISRVERIPELAHADLFADVSSDTPLKELEGHISFLRTDGPGASPNAPMAIVQMPIMQIESPRIPDGKYYIKNRASDLYWVAENFKGGLKAVPGHIFWLTEVKLAEIHNYSKVNEHSSSPIIQVLRG